MKERGQIPSYMIVSQCKLHHTNSNITSVRMENISHRKKTLFFLDILSGSLATDLLFHSKKRGEVKK